MSKFVSGVSNMVYKDCKAAMLIKEMDILRYMTYVEYFKDEKMRDKARKSKRAHIDGCSFLHEGLIMIEMVHGS